LSKSAENGFGAASRAVLVDGYTSKLPQSDLYRHALRVLCQWISNNYDCNVWSEQKRVEKLRYIHRNPVKRGLVERPEDWFV